MNNQPPTSVVVSHVYPRRQYVMARANVNAAVTSVKTAKSVS